MEIKNENYPLYASIPVKEIPHDTLVDLVIELSTNAMFVLGASLESSMIKPTVEKIVEMLRDKFSVYPLHLVAEAFDQGALGQLGGTMRFIPRNIYIWLAAVRDRDNRLKYEQWSKQEDKRRAEEEGRWKSNHRGDAVFGTALCLKLTWVYSGAITAEEWDNITLDSIVTLLRAGESEYTITPSMVRS